MWTYQDRGTGMRGQLAIDYILIRKKSVLNTESYDINWLRSQSNHFGGAIDIRDAGLEGLLCSTRPAKSIHCSGNTQ